MSTAYKVLERDKDFFVAALAQSQVSVWFRLDPDPIGHLINYGGVVEEFTPDSITLSGSNFVRQRFEFRMEVRMV
jgi:hypothetical protein